MGNGPNAMLFDVAMKQLVDCGTIGTPTTHPILPILSILPLYTPYTLLQGLPPSPAYFPPVESICDYPFLSHPVIVASTKWTDVAIVCRWDIGMHGESVDSLDVSTSIYKQPVAHKQVLMDWPRGLLINGCRPFAPHCRPSVSDAIPRFRCPGPKIRLCGIGCIARILWRWDRPKARVG